MTWIAKISDYDRDADRRHARKMLARMIPSSRWRQDRDPRIGLRVAREVMKLADLTPEEERRESARLELDAATAFAEGSDHDRA